MTDAKIMDLDPELFSELTEPLVQPLLVHMVPPFANGNDPKFACKLTGIFCGSGEAGSEFEETVCGPSSELTKEWM